MIESYVDPTDYHEVSIDISCDNCSDADSFSSYDGFEGCILNAKNDDWVIKRKREEFFHYCSSDCANEAENPFSSIKLE